MIDADLSTIKDFSVKPVDSVLCVLWVCVLNERNASRQACHVVHWDVDIPAQCGQQWRDGSPQSAMIWAILHGVQPGFCARMVLRARL